MLDEFTSALDSVSEAELTAAVQELRGRTTVVIVAHLLTSVRNCELKYLIGVGRVLEEGDYEKLTGRLCGLPVLGGLHLPPPGPDRCARLRGPAAPLPHDD